MTYTTLISATELKELMNGAKPLIVFDCSFDLTDSAKGEQQFFEAHIPDAVYAHLDTALSAKGDPALTKAASGGRHPLPSRDVFAQWLGSVGMGNDMQAVVYDRQGANYCGRLWWMLKWAGHDAVAVLDGGLQAWQATGGAVGSGPGKVKAKQKYALAPELRALKATETIATKLTSGDQTLIDARGAPRYRGEVEPLDPVAGHIPGALNRPFTSNFTSEGLFKPASVLRAEFESLLGARDASTVVHHCGSGVSALPNLLAMEVAGLGPTALYAGSWSEWCSDPKRPVARG